MTGSSSEIAFMPYDQVYGQGIDDMLHRVPSIEKIRSTIGWAPRLDLDVILADVIEHKRTTPAQLVEPEAVGA
jgi:UDP-glucose 4-epimerase